MRLLAFAFAVIMLVCAFPSHSISYAQLPPVVALKIISPVEGQKVPVGQLTVSGTSKDDVNTDCRVDINWNDQVPFQKAIAVGPGGANDYSHWTSTFSGNYHIIEGINKITAILSCPNNPNSGVDYSVNVIGVAGQQPMTTRGTTLPSEPTIGGGTSTMGGGTSTTIATVDVFRDITFCVMADGGGGPGHADKKSGHADKKSGNGGTGNGGTGNGGTGGGTHQQAAGANDGTLPTPHKFDKCKVRTITHVKEKGKSIPLPPGTVTHIKFVGGQAIVTIIDKDGDGNINNEIQQVKDSLNLQSIQCG
ncbi:MAG TPA: hypothetical protein VFI70_07580 [Nitrososphaeraceae archaeon]|nr:hypothetical protein [Nitrososphaeraceae archaeon]